jgi:hypothetical protein
LVATAPAPGQLVGLWQGTLRDPQAEGFSAVVDASRPPGS